MTQSTLQKGSRLALAVIGALVGLVVLLPLMLLGLPFWVTAAAVRAGRRIRSRSHHQVVEWREAIEYEPVIGWRTRPGLDVRLAGPDGAFRVTTDEMGARGPVSLDTADIVVLGDSFAFGHAADDDFFFPYQVSRRRVTALGANGYNLVQELLWMERLASRLKGKTVVWMVFYGNDLYDNLAPNHERYRMPFVRRRKGNGGWEVVTSHVNSTAWPFYEVRNDQRKLAEICSGTRLTDRAFSACRYLLRRGLTLCQEAGAELVVMGVPEKWQLSDGGRKALRARSPKPESFDADLPDRELEAICDDLGVRFVAVSGLLPAEDHLSGDCHWNRTGHAKVAELLTSFHSAGPRKAGAAEAPGRRRSKSRRAAT